MKILIIQPFLSWGGAEAVSLQFAGHLKGAKVVALYKDKNLPYGAGNTQIITLPGLISNLLQNYRTFLIIFGFPMLLYLTLKNSKNFNVINPHNFPSLWIAVIVGKIRKIPVVWTVHNFPQSQFPVFLDKFFARRCKAIVAVSEKVAIQVWDSYKLKAELLYPGIDYNFFGNGKKIPGCKNKFVVLTAGRLKKEKSFDLAIRAFAKASEKIKNAVFVVAGTGPDLVRLKAMTHELGAKVEFVGYRTPTQLRDWYKTADLFVLPSYKTEGCNLSPLEALCAGTPSLVVEGSGVDEIVKKNRLGFVTQPTVKDFSEKILYFYRYRNPVRLGSVWIKNNLSWPIYVKKFLQLL